MLKTEYAIQHLKRSDLLDEEFVGVFDTLEEAIGWRDQYNGSEDRRSWIVVGRIVTPWEPVSRGSDWPEDD